MYSILVHVLLVSVLGCAASSLQSREIPIHDTMNPDLNTLLQQAGVSFGQASWEGTAPWCKGECSAGDLQVAVLSEENSNWIATQSNFGSTCFIGDEALCTSAYNKCTTSTVSLQFQCADAVHPARSNSWILSGCELINPGPLCSAPSSTVMVRLLNPPKRSDSNAIGPGTFRADVEASCCT
ncbi:hypothetical protein DACRYDRAFT_25563 [Dacryopinax primogenitus]|uniref:Uncharacterized protein n=1 Tax=Dacryopinax primogenitus (strain DJM 731) TaxID=1858805 RepID=M5FPW4_DACPD|nr:uncharacterized protein DACRYDRAFT_25563 [Dacryopinax primogenitus]EJT96614.1 hypothetical protein DACRYDRAFT_25563 [Dacryopinax primogenitus]